jgi:hypothetical protein
VATLADLKRVMLWMCEEPPMEGTPYEVEVDDDEDDM